MTLSQLPFGYKLAITLFLINVLLGLLFAEIEIRYVVEMKDAEAGISFNDFRIYFQGNPTVCRLQTALAGSSHSNYASADEIQTVADWIADGEPRATYDSDIAPLFASRCISCHGPGGERADSPLTNYDQVTSYTSFFDTGVSYETLATNSFLYLIALTCFTGLLAAVFYQTRFRGIWKPTVLVVSFFMIFINVLSWWSAKQSVPFIHIVLASGLIFGVLIIVMTLMTLADLWILPEERA